MDKKTINADMPLNEVLEALGYKTRKHGKFGAKAIVSSSNEVVFTGRAGEVWKWLRKTQQID